VRHVVESFDGVIFSDENNGEVIFAALVPTLKDFVFGHRDGGRAFDATFDFDMTRLW
jgi:hypothetical protein